MMKLMNALMLSCVKATQLTEMKKHVPLGFIKTVQLYMHTALCSGCRNYTKQTEIVDELLRSNFEEAPPLSTDKLETKIIKEIF